MRVWTARVCVILAVLAGALAGCGGPDAGLAGTKWVLTGIQQGGAARPLAAGAEVTLQFTADQASGSSGCNSYGGGYAARGSSIEFRDLASTLMACADTAAMEQEAAYLQILTDATGFQRGAASLTVTGPTGALSFRST